MSQNNYKLNIVESLLMKANHIRGLARAVDTSQTTIARLVQSLHKDNVVDYKVEGRNKVFFLKNTLEAKQYACMVEQYKLLRLLKKYPVFRRIIEHIRKNEKIHLAILFGSYARFSAGRNSDIDIYVDSKDSSIKKYVEQIDSSISVKLGRYSRENKLIKEIEKNHIILTGVEEFNEKNNFFSKVS